MRKGPQRCGPFFTTSPFVIASNAKQSSVVQRRLGFVDLPPPSAPLHSQRRDGHSASNDLTRRREDIAPRRNMASSLRRPRQTQWNDLPPAPPFSAAIFASSRENILAQRHEGTKRGDETRLLTTRSDRLFNPDEVLSVAAIRSGQHHVPDTRRIDSADCCFCRQR